MVVKMITEKKEQVKNKSVLLFSGGMDSVIFNKLLNPDVLLYINSGVNYESEEKRCLSNLISNKYIDKKKLIILDNVVNLSQFERDDKIVPNRNAILMMIASLYGETLYLGSVSGDRSFDKDEKFYKLIKKLLDHMWEEQHWTEKREFKILSPYKNTTKTELVKKYLELNNDPESLFVSFSCYDPVSVYPYMPFNFHFYPFHYSVPCGQCKPCFRKWVSLINNNVKIPKNYFYKDPWRVKWLHNVLPLIRIGKWRGKEDKDIWSALEKQQDFNLKSVAKKLALEIISKQ